MQNVFPANTEKHPLIIKPLVRISDLHERSSPHAAQVVTEATGIATVRHHREQCARLALREAVGAFEEFGDNDDWLRASNLAAPNAALTAADLATALIRYYGKNTEELRSLFDSQVAVDEEVWTRWEMRIEKLSATGHVEDGGQIRELARPWSYLWSSWLCRHPLIEITPTHLLLSLTSTCILPFVASRQWSGALTYLEMESHLRGYLATVLGESATTIERGWNVGQWIVPDLQLPDSPSPSLNAWVKTWPQLEVVLNRRIPLPLLLGAFHEANIDHGEVEFTIAELLGGAGVTAAVFQRRWDGVGEPPSTRVDLVHARSVAWSWQRLLKAVERHGLEGLRPRQRERLEQLGQPALESLLAFRGLLGYEDELHSDWAKNAGLPFT